MKFCPNVSDFSSFSDLILDASKIGQCMYMMLEGRRCKHACNKHDQNQAASLRNTIYSTSSECLDPHLLRAYILSNCCNSGRHKRILEDNTGLLTQLVQRWRDEICELLKRTTPLKGCISATTDTPLVKVEPSLGSNSTYTQYISLRKSSDLRTQDSKSNSVNPNLTKFTGFGNQKDYSTAEGHKVEPSPSGNEPRYNLRSLETSNPTPDQPECINQPTQSEFRPHKEKPGPRDSVFYKIKQPIRHNSRDTETGSLYIFWRESSPGFFKIGWTAKAVTKRLAEWTKCGYTPELLFKIDDVPHAQRVESLVHFELMKEWRRERACKKCGASHQEWFETEPERAIQVLRDFAMFMKMAKPYDAAGFLKSQWEQTVRGIHMKGELVTGKTLLERYEAITRCQQDDGKVGLSTPTSCPLDGNERIYGRGITESGRCLNEPDLGELERRASSLQSSLVSTQRETRRLMELINELCRSLPAPSGTIGSSGLYVGNTSCARAPSAVRIAAPA